MIDKAVLEVCAFHIDCFLIDEDAARFGLNYAFTQTAE